MLSQRSFVTCCPATGAFSALLFLNASAAQSAVCAGWYSSLRRAIPSFSLLNAGRWKASYVSLCARFRTAVLTGDWRFQRSSVPGVTPGIYACAIEISLPSWICVQPRIAELCRTCYPFGMIGTLLAPGWQVPRRLVPMRTLQPSWPQSQLLHYLLTQRPL